VITIIRPKHSHLFELRHNGALIIASGHKEILGARLLDLMVKEGSETVAYNDERSMTARAADTKTE
jgi:hypothetical protein